MIYTKKAISRTNANYNIASQYRNLSTSLTTFDSYVAPRERALPVEIGNIANYLNNFLTNEERQNHPVQNIEQYDQVIKSFFAYSLKYFIRNNNLLNKYEADTYASSDHIRSVSSTRRQIFTNPNDSSYVNSRYVNSSSEIPGNYHNGNNLAQFMHPVNLEHVKLWNTINKQELLRKDKIKLLLDRLYVDNVINENIYQTLLVENENGSPNKLYEIYFKYFESIVELANKLHEDNILIDNTQPFLLNRNIFSNQAKGFVADLYTSFFNLFDYENTKEKTTEIYVGYARKYDDFSILTTPKTTLEYNGLKVFSQIPSLLLHDLIDIVVIDHVLPIDPGTNAVFTKHKRDPISSLDDFQVGLIGDIAFTDEVNLKVSKKNLFQESSGLVKQYPWPGGTYKNYALRIDKELTELLENNESIETINLTQEIRNSIKAKKKVKALYFKNNKDDNSSELNYEIESLTPSQFESKSAFIPVMYRINYDDSETINNGLPQKQGYYLVLACTQGLENTLHKYTKWQNQILKLADYLSDKKKQLYFQDKELFFKKQREELDGYGKYVDNYTYLKDLLNDIDSPLREFINEDNLNYTRHMKAISGRNLNILNAKPKIDNQNLEKLKEAKENLTSKMKINLESIAKEMRMQSRLQSRVVRQKEQITSYLEAIEDLKLQLTQMLDEGKLLIKSNDYAKNIKEIQSYTKSFLQVNNLWSQSQTEYQEQLKKAIEDKQFEENPYLLNLAQNNVFVTKVHTINSSVLSSQSTEEEFINQRKNENLKISQVDFSVNKIIEIKVDGKANNIVYGGPYVISVTDNSLQIGLLNRSSIFGKSENNEIKVHPHASSISIRDRDISLLRQIYSEKHRGCLGESAPYIYKAFKENNLAMIILNTMVWLTSANSSDVWGRSWPWFPNKIGDTGFDFKYSEDIAETILNAINEEENCEHDYENEICVHCGMQCQNHQYEYDGICLVCGHYNSDYDTTQDYDDDDSENETNNTTTTVNTTEYVPYAQLTTQNNNEGQRE